MPRSQSASLRSCWQRSISKEEVRLGRPYKALIYLHACTGQVNAKAILIELALDRLEQFLIQDGSLFPGKGFTIKVRATELGKLAAWERGMFHINSIRTALLILIACLAMPEKVQAQTCNTEGNIKTCTDRVGNLVTLIKSDAAGNVLQWGVSSSDRHRDVSNTIALIGTTMVILVPNSKPDDRADALVKIIGEADKGRDTSVQLGDFRWKAVTSGTSISVVAVRVAH